MDVHSLPLEIRITCVRLALGTWYKALALPEKQHKDNMKDVYDFIVKGNVHSGRVNFYLIETSEEALNLSHPENNGFWHENWTYDKCVWDGHHASYNYCKFKAKHLCERLKEIEGGSSGRFITGEDILNGKTTSLEVWIEKRKGDNGNPYIEGRRVRMGTSRLWEKTEGYWYWYHPKCRCSTCDRVRYYSGKDDIPYSEYMKVRHIFWGFLERQWKALFSMRDATHFPID